MRRLVALGSLLGLVGCGVHSFRPRADAGEVDGPAPTRDAMPDDAPASDTTSTEPAHDAASDLAVMDAPPGDAWALAPGACTGGTWKPGLLEIHHIDVGQADAALIVGPTGRTLLVDVGEEIGADGKGALTVARYVEAVLGCRRIDTVLISHFHSDHVGIVGASGLWSLVNQQGFTVGRTLHRDLTRFVGQAGTVWTGWRDYLASAAGKSQLNPAVAVPGTGQVDLGPGVTFTIVGVDGAGSLRAGDFRQDPAPPNENDFSVASVLRFGSFDYFTGGDLSGQYIRSTNGYSYHDVEREVARAVGDVDVYRVNHHGSHSSSSATFLAEIDPEVSIVSCGDSNGYGHPDQDTVQRLLATSEVYLTERGDKRQAVGAAIVGGDVVVRTSDGVAYTVNGKSRLATDPVRVDGDRDGYFQEADPNDGSASVWPARTGGCDPAYQSCP